MSPSRLQRCAAEAAGTALLVGIGTAAIVVGARAGGVPQWVLAVAWFGAVAIPVFAFARWSGSHINPAVTLMLVLGRRFPAGDDARYLPNQRATRASFTYRFPARALCLVTRSVPW